MTIVATLAVCLGATATTYAVVDAVLLRGLPFDRPEHLLWVSSVSQGRPDRPFSLPEFLDYRSGATTVRLAAYTTWNAILDAPSGATRLQGLRLSGDGFAVIGARPALGRALTAEDDVPGAPRVAMVGYGYWRRSLAGDSAALGRELVLNGERFTVVGVLPRFFPIPVRDIDVIVPLDPLSDPRRSARGSVNFLRVLARVRDNSTATIASRELNEIAARLRERFPTEYASKIGVRVLPLHDYIASNQRETIIVVFTCVTLMLMTAIVNVTSLLLARAVARRGETAIRLALGASIGRVFLEVLLESALLVTAAGIVGLAIAQVGTGVVANRFASLVPRIEEVKLSASVIMMVVGAAGIAFCLFSLVAIFASRGTPPQLAVRGAGRSVAGSSAQISVRSAFVIVQVALTIVMSTATAALARSLFTLERIDLGFQPDSVFVARLTLPPTSYRTAAELGRFGTAMEAALSRVPGVVAAGGVSVAPLSGVLRAVPFAPANSPTSAKRDWPAANYRAISPGYLRALGGRQVAGRTIEEGDNGSAPAVVVINRVLAETFFPGGSAVGHQILVNDTNHEPRALTIVGIVENVREIDLDRTIEPEVFVAVKQVPQESVSFLTATQFWAVRVGGKPMLFEPVFAKTLRDVDRSVAAAGSSTLRRFVDGALAPRRFSVRLMSVFALIALVLTFVGVYGVTAYLVEQRRREIGVRMALGATQARVVGNIVRRSLTLASIGAALGMLGAWMTRGLMESQLFGVSANSPSLFAAVVGLMLMTVAAASLVPGLRASRVDPLVALRGD